MTTSTPLHFRTSSYSGGSTQNCVEVADVDGGSAIRDTQNRHLGHLTIADAREWHALLAVARRDQA